MSVAEAQRRSCTAAAALAGSGQSKVANVVSISAKPCQGAFTRTSIGFLRELMYCNMCSLFTSEGHCNDFHAGDQAGQAAIWQCPVTLKRWAGPRT